MTHIAPLLRLILTSSLLAWTLSDASILCSWTKVLPNKEVHYSFLRSDPRQASPSLRLYHSSWSAQRALLRCAWSDDVAVIQNYFSLCQERTHEFSDQPDDSFDVDSMFEAEDACVSVASPEVVVRPERTAKRLVRSAGGRTAAGSQQENHHGPAEGSEVRRLQRVKRGFIVPGTLWCGSGNKAPSFEDLGVFTETDSCCREHDQCKHTILSFHSQFGVFNSNIFTMSHCDCDKRFHSCLMEAQDSISDVVGYTFFNLLKMHCFEFSHRLQCTQRNWFGMCKETKMALYAEVHPPTVYESTEPTEVSPFINTTTPTELLETSTPHPHGSISIATAASTVPPPSVIPGSGAATSEPVSGKTDELENTLSTGKQTLPGLDFAETRQSCAVYKDLDKCENKIFPQQTRYGLHNTEATTLYHCNCTARLFQTLAKQRQLTEVQALLLGHVSPSCFLPQDCTAGNTCSAVLVRADLPQVNQRSSTDMEEQRHLQAVALKVRRPNSRRAKRKDRAVRLRKLCLQMSRPKLNKRPAVRRRELE